MKRLFVLLVVLAATPIALAAAPSYQFKPDDKSMTIWVKASKPEFQVVLQSNRTTGFRWFVASYDNGMVKPLKQSFQAPRSELIGAPGQSIWQFKLLPAAYTVPQVTKVVMWYMRPWGAGAATQKIIYVVSAPTDS